MIITLKDTMSSQIASRLVEERDERGASALGRVMTLIVIVGNIIDVDAAIEISDAASREHPCRVIVVVDDPEANPEAAARLDAQLRVGESAGASEVVVLNPKGGATQDLDLLVMPLLLSDTPVVAYWPGVPPTDPAKHPLGTIAGRRITDTRETDCPLDTLAALSTVYQDGDTDLSWSGITLWRALLTSVASQFDRLPQSVLVRGHSTHPSSFLIAAWLHRQLGIEVVQESDPKAKTVTGVFFHFDNGDEVSLVRAADSSVATLSRPNVDPAPVNLPRRHTRDCLMEELRRLNADRYYGQILTEVLPDLARDHVLDGLADSEN
ncbi:glucose-6-phosphate dehydrogenase assembly protein OpcA [Schaalia vaccimaxillae]|uniref:glucose-6-phosphate dehydrogenase assembly protein OpcA n=1 Tax=Schaalia vaccimaxillae TaxID=183916 RepID=UPI0004164A2C|nr:glucose-6-phosphate dehydrogenase assembly protein OpcA [Schaalia vaccimaxillae]